MKSSIVVAALAVAVVCGLVLMQQAHAERVCPERYEAWTLELVGVTVDGEAQPSLDEYDGREFLLQIDGQPGVDLLFVILHDEQIEAIRAIELNGTDEEAEVEETL